MLMPEVSRSDAETGNFRISVAWSQEHITGGRAVTKIEDPPPVGIRRSFPVNPVFNRNTVIPGYPGRQTDEIVDSVKGKRVAGAEKQRCGRD